MELTAAPTWDIAASMRTCGWKEIFMTLAPLTVCESIDFTSLTTAITNSLNVVTLCSISFAGKPEYDQITVTTGISILGKDVRRRRGNRREAQHQNQNRSYYEGVRFVSASRTIHICSLQQSLQQSAYT